MGSKSYVSWSVDYKYTCTTAWVCESQHIVPRTMARFEFFGGIFLLLARAFMYRMGRLFGNWSHIQMIIGIIYIFIYSPV